MTNKSGNCKGMYDGDPNKESLINAPLDEVKRRLSIAYRSGEGNRDMPPRWTYDNGRGEYYTSRFDVDLRQALDDLGSKISLSVSQVLPGIAIDRNAEEWVGALLAATCKTLSDQELLILLYVNNIDREASSLLMSEIRHVITDPERIRRDLNGDKYARSMFHSTQENGLVTKCPFKAASLRVLRASLRWRDAQNNIPGIDEDSFLRQLRVQATAEARERDEHNSSGLVRFIVYQGAV